MSDGSLGWRDAKDVLKELWSNRKEIVAFMKGIREWFRLPAPAPGILILGPAGVGKTTLARFLSGDYDLLLDPPGPYSESLGIEEYTLKDAEKVEVVVLPGQRHRRDASWTDVLHDLSDGAYRGVIIAAASGHQSIPLASYKDHKLYHGNKAEFLQSLLADSRKDEIEVLKRLLPAVRLCKNKVWLLTHVGKQDLWWPEKAEVDQYYREGEYAAAIREGLGPTDDRQCYRELAFSSLVISNLTTLGGEVLKTNAAGYDQALQVQTLRRLLETVDALRQWEDRK